MKNEDKNDINDENIYKKYEIYYIPKVLCFASLMPFPNKLYKILTNIYDFYKYQAIDNKNSISYPIEKIIEKIVMSLPFPIMKDHDISLLFELNSLNKTIFTYQRIIFSSYEFRDYYLHKSYDLDISELFLNNSEEIIVNIFKNILLENCVLFFSEHRQYLSNTIECFLNILSPFKYIYSNITILPQKYFGLIHSQEKFIFGINQKYSEDFFINNQISVNKNILIVIIKKNEKNEIKIMTEEIFCREETKLEYIISLNINNNKQENKTNKNNLFNIDLPIKNKKKILFKLKNYLNLIKTNMKKNIFENENIFKSTILNIFHKFFIDILSGYTKYLLKSPNHNYFGYNIRYKYTEKNNDIILIKEIFDLDGFLSKIPKENQIFYKTFFNTKLFYNFLRSIIYPNNEIDSLEHKYFDFLSFLKKEKTKRKSEEFCEQYQKYKKPFGKKKNSNKIKFVISDNINFNEYEKNILIKKEKQYQALEGYYQLIEINNNNNKDNKDSVGNGNCVSFKYFIFPKLLFDNNFFEINYNIQFYRHLIDLPSDKIIKELNTFISESENEFLSKCNFVIYKDTYNNNSSSLFELYSNDYIEFNWLLLSSCSLWYCNTNKEKEIRINKIFDVLNKLEYIEEQVLHFVFYSIYKYGSIPHFIRIFEIIQRFLGYYSYNDLLLLYNKLKEDKINLIENEKEKNLIVQKRSFIDIKIYIDNEFDDKIKEEIIFSNEQICEKCGNVIKLNEQEISEIINKKIDKNKNATIFKCKICKKNNIGLKIEYKLSLVNIRKKREKLVSKDKFDLIMPHILYVKIKDYLINLKENKIDINHIFSKHNIDILNFIFYFSLKSLPFDFLFPYTDINNKINEEREYFFNYDYIHKKGKKKFDNIFPVNNDKFILDLSKKEQ